MACAVMAVTYFVLLVWALIMGSGIGSPVSYPLGLVMIILFGVVFGWGICMPACGIGAFVCRFFDWPRLVAIPIVWISAMIFSGIGSWTVHRLTGSQLIPSMGMSYVIFLSVLLGVYWWLTEGPFAIYEMICRRFSGFSTRISKHWS